MTSSMLAGERRWATSRRGGMTGSGKLAVPKPLNLPSQKSENHGLDPNVEIVPKGSLSWGSRPSSSTSNPWSSSAVSPNADGSTVSPHYPSGRPSSGGGLSRPSTSGSDKIHESPATTWGPTSRPSSASGVLTSNQPSLASSRPLSLETRPGSSHLSRFAEPAFDNSMAWGPNGTSDKLSIPSKINDFSLATGDFPTLGSEKDSAKNSKTHDQSSHVRPGSSSGRTAPTKEKIEMFQADANSGNVQTWTRDGSPHVEDGVLPSAEKWQGGPQQYVNPNVPPQHFDAWHGPPVNAPSGVWYRGPPAGPPYPPVPHGGFPMESFPYYRPQIPPLANSQPGPPPGSGPRGHLPRNGDFYRPQMPDTFIRPGMPIRPGFYPGPVPYDGYFRPPMGYNANDRDMPYMGMPPGPPVYNMGPPQNPSELGDPHYRAGGHMYVSEQLDSVPRDESQGPYKVLRKRENERDADMEEDSWEQTPAVNSLALENSDQSRSSFPNNDWGTDTKRNEDMPSRRKTLVENPSFSMLSDQGYPSESVIMHPPKASNENWGKKSEPVSPYFSEMTKDIPTNSKDSSLIQKIEGLNAKVRASDARGVAISGSIREDQKDALLANPNDIPTVAFGSISNSDINILRGDITSKATTASASQISRQVHHRVQSRADHHSKGRSNNQDSDGWRKKPQNQGSEGAASFSNQNVAHASTLHVPDNYVSAENMETKNTGDSVPQMVDPTDGQAQRARMRELAKQRAIQLQKEEEERTREQKAKALAKLEELNRRTLATDASPQTAEKTVTGVSEQENGDGFQKPVSPAIDASKHEIQSSDLDKNSESGFGQSATMSRDLGLHASKNSPQDHVSHDQLKQNVADATDTESKTASHGNDGSLPRQKRVSHRQKQSVQMVESSAAKSTTNVPISDEAVPIQELRVTNRPNILAESTQQRKRSNKSSKYKHKLDDTVAATGSSSAFKEGDLAKLSTESGKPESLQVDLDSSIVLGTESLQVDLDSSIVLGTDNKDSVQINLEQTSPLPSEEAHGKTTNQYKSQNSRRVSRNPQANRSGDRSQVGDAVVWAPVRAQNKEEHGNEYSQRTMQDDVPLTAKSVNSVQTNTKSKRAEMERYVLKPVAKEMQQHGSIQQSSSLSSPSPSPSSPGKSAIEDMSSKEELGSIVESKNGDNKQNRQVKSHGAWRQRGPSESHREQGLQQGAHMTSNPKKNDHKSMTQQPEASNPIPTETNVMHEWDPSDGWFMPEYPPTEVSPVTTVVKDEGGKGKRPAYKGQRSTMKNHDVNHKDVNSAEVEKPFMQSTKSLEVDQIERPASKENHSSHWQPKSQPNRGGQNASLEVKRDSSNDGRRYNSHFQPEESGAAYKNQRTPHDEDQEGRREKKPVTSRGHLHSQNQHHGNNEDEARFGQHHASSGFRKPGGGQNNRSGGQDNRRQNNANINRERQRQNAHFEYQPVGSTNSSSNKSRNPEAPADGSGNASLRYKERGFGQSRRGGGNFYGPE